MWFLVFLVASSSNPDTPGKIEIVFQDKEQCISALQRLEQTNNPRNYTFISRCEKKSSIK